MQVLDFVIHGVILGESYRQLSNIFRSDMEGKMWIIFLTGLIFSFFFVFVYARGCEDKGIMEGIRYGLIIACFFAIPHMYGQYVIYPLPYALVLQWVIYEFIKLVIMGVAVAVIYRPVKLNVH
jgi:hypothetical protein